MLEKQNAKLALRRHEVEDILRKKIRPFTKSPELVPIEIFFLLSTYDGSLVRKFCLLCKGLKRHVVFHFKKLIEPAIANFKKAYSRFFEFKSVRLWERKIEFNG